MDRDEVNFPFPVRIRTRYRSRSDDGGSQYLAMPRGRTVRMPIPPEDASQR